MKGRWGVVGKRIEDRSNEGNLQVLCVFIDNIPLMGMRGGVRAESKEGIPEAVR